MLPYQHFKSTGNLSKSVFSTLPVSFLHAPTFFTVNHVISLHVHIVLMFFNNICHVNKVSPYIPLYVNTRKTLVDVSHNVRHVQCPRCVAFKSKVSNTSNFKHIFLSTLYKILAAILFNTFSFYESAKSISGCNIALLLLIYVKFYTKNSLIYSRKVDLLYNSV